VITVRKIVLLSTIAVLALSIVVVAPMSVHALITKESYWAHHEMDVVDPGKIWVSEENIQHVKDSYWAGTNDGSLGVGTFEVWYNQISLDLASGEGTFSGKFLVTIPGKGTIAGTGRGTITGFVYSLGTFIGTHGTGDFEGLIAKGSFEATFTSATHFGMDCVGTSMYP
jgi:hypothetical protein